MGFVSSLVLFHPGDPPGISPESLKDLAVAIREVCGVGEDSRGSIGIKWGDRIDQDLKDTSGEESPEEWPESGVLISEVRDYPWDVEREFQGQEEFDRLYPAGERRNLYRARVDLGSLMEDSIRELVVQSESDPSLFIAPDCCSIEVGPVTPCTLEDDELTCTGFLSVHFSGNGLFGWNRPYTNFWETFGSAAAVTETMRVCRDFFPVPATDLIRRNRDFLGEMFLNRETYSEGDWIASFQEK